jgi:hypothetical protein
MVLARCSKVNGCSMANQYESSLFVHTRRTPVLMRSHHRDPCISIMSYIGLIDPSWSPCGVQLHLSEKILVIPSTQYARSTMQSRVIRGWHSWRNSPIGDGDIKIQPLGVISNFGFHMLSGFTQEEVCVMTSKCTDDVQPRGWDRL